MNSGSTPQRELVFFLDKCLGRNIVANSLRACGEHVEIKEDHFPCDTEDDVWIPRVGEKGWIILTKDRQLRHNTIELIALLKSGTHSFILTSSSQSGADMARSFVNGLPHIKALIAKFRAPLICTVSPSGNVSVYFTHDQLIEQITKNKRGEENLEIFKKSLPPGGPDALNPKAPTSPPPS